MFPSWCNGRVIIAGWIRKLVLRVRLSDMQSGHYRISAPEPCSSQTVVGTIWTKTYSMPLKIFAQLSGTSQQIRRSMFSRVTRLSYRKWNARRGRGRSNINLDLFAITRGRKRAVFPILAKPVFWEWPQVLWEMWTQCETRMHFAKRARRWYSVGWLWMLTKNGRSQCLNHIRKTSFESNVKFSRTLTGSYDFEIYFIDTDTNLKNDIFGLS